MSATPLSMIRIVSEGLQDIERLNAPIGLPSVQFFSVVLRKRTRWSRQWRRVEFDGLADFGRTATTTLPILGELITRAILVVNLPSLPQVPTGAVAPIWSWTNSIGNALCSDMTLTIGSTTVDTLDSRLLEVITEHETIPEHFDSTNLLLGRFSAHFSPTVANASIPPAASGSSVELIPPFWWNRGVGPHALPIQALNRDKVQIQVTFRTIQECVYTETRVSDSVAFQSSGPGPLPTLATCPFVDASGAVVLGPPTHGPYHFSDAFWIIEYVNLEGREAAAFRLGDLQIPILQHIALPPQNSVGRQARVPIKPGGLIRDMVWVAQRVEAPTYNNYFLFSRDLHGPRDPSGTIWWPNAQIPDWNYGDGYMLPAFVDRYSDPILGATLLTQGVVRFEHDGPSIFRSLIPILGSKRAPWTDRYVYRYDFGLYPTGDLESDNVNCEYEYRGAANWDLIQQKELVLDMAPPTGPGYSWGDVSGATIYSAGTLRALDSGSDGFRVVLGGSGPNDVSGSGTGSQITCIVNMTQIRRIPGFSKIFVRTVNGGSSALLVECTTGIFIWLAVAAGGGRGSTGVQGGNAAPIATQISFQGGNAVQTHDASGGGGGGGVLGGGGGGMAPLIPGPGLPDGGPAFPTNNAGFVNNLTYNGGMGGGVYGGDGYYGGGSGTVSGGGGGGGSYISSYVEQVTTSISLGPASASVTPLQRRQTPPPEMTLYVWLTRWNMLRIQGGRGVLMFSE